MYKEKWSREKTQGRLGVDWVKIIWVTIWMLGLIGCHWGIFEEKLLLFCKSITSPVVRQ